MHSAKPVDRDQDSHYVGVIIALLTTIILLLVAAIMFIVSRNKRSPRSDVLNSLQHNFNQDTLGLGIDKRHHMKVIFCKSFHFLVTFSLCVNNGIPVNYPKITHHHGNENACDINQVLSFEFAVISSLIKFQLNDFRNECALLLLLLLKSLNNPAKNRFICWFYRA